MCNPVLGLLHHLRERGGREGTDAPPVPWCEYFVIPWQLRKFRAAPTVEFLRATWEKTSNPYVRRDYIPGIASRRTEEFHWDVDTTV